MAANANARFGPLARERPHNAANTMAKPNRPRASHRAARRVPNVDRRNGTAASSRIEIADPDARPSRPGVLSARIHAV